MFVLQFIVLSWGESMLPSKLVAVTSAAISLLDFHFTIHTLDS